MDFAGQLYTFLTTMVIGVSLGFIFDFYRVLRGIFKPRSVVTYMFDFFYWLLAIIITFGGLLASNWGELRFYVFIGLLGGAVLYFRLISRFSILILVRTIRMVLFVVGWIKMVVTKLFIKPLMYCLGVFVVPFTYAGRKTARAKNKVTVWLKSKLQPPNQDIPPE